MSGLITAIDRLFHSFQHCRVDSCHYTWWPTSKPIVDALSAIVIVWHHDAERTFIDETLIDLAPGLVNHGDR